MCMYCHRDDATAATSYTIAHLAAHGDGNTACIRQQPDGTTFCIDCGLPVVGTVEDNDHCCYM